MQFPTVKLPWFGWVFHHLPTLTTAGATSLGKVYPTLDHRMSHELLQSIVPVESMCPGTRITVANKGCLGWDSLLNMFHNPGADDCILAGICELYLT